MTMPKTIGRYEVIDELGRGAMGSVYRANDPMMSRTVAIKTILATALASENGAEFRKRFTREAQAAGVLTHPGIVAVYDVGEQDGSPYLVMEFVQGRTLDAVMKKGDRMSLERIAEIGEQIAEALNFAHRNGVVHRDIKPANILMTSKEVYGFERPKITDFGVAKLQAGDITTTGQMLGTPAFMPPEQFTGAPIDGRTDLFSLGVILYQMATGEQPFPGETMTSVSYKIVHTDPVPPSKLNPLVPVKLDGIILKCLAKSPADRFQTGEELAQELAGFRGTRDPVLATKVAAAAPAKVDPNQTLDSGAMKMQQQKEPAAAKPPKPPKVKKPATPLTPAQKKTRALVITGIAALFFLAAVIGGWLYIRNQAQQSEANTPPPSQQTATPAPQQPQAQPQAASPAPTTAANTQSSLKPSGALKPQAGKSAPAAPAQTSNTPAPVQTQAPAPAPQPEPVKPSNAGGALGFDPLKLDGKQNAHIKVDLNHFGPGVSFALYMNDKLYYKGTYDVHPDMDKLMVPPGVQHFRVEVSCNGVVKNSNVVSAEFVAKKRVNLKVEIRPPDKPTAGANAALDPAAQVIATMKQAFSLFN